MKGIPCDARRREIDIYEAKTRELPRPVPRDPGPVPGPWSAEDGRASLPTGEALVQVGETITIAAHNDHNTITHLIRFLEWMRAGGTIQGDER